MSFELGQMSLQELKDLRTRVDKAINGYKERKRKEALAELEEKARALGFTFEELTGVPIPRKRSPVAPKYANPANPAETWSGRGRKPRWFEAALASGKTREDLEI
ncbi:MAG: H-NS histone family protein [Gemmobacter sp.]